MSKMNLKEHAKLQKALNQLPCKATLVAIHNIEPHLDAVLVRCDKSGDCPSNMDKSLHHPGYYASGRSAIEFVVWWYNRDCPGLGSGSYHCVCDYDGNETLALTHAAITFAKRAKLDVKALSVTLSEYAEHVANPFKR